MPAHRWRQCRLTGGARKRRCFHSGGPSPDGEPDPSHRPAVGPGDPDTPRLPLEPGEWDIPRVPLLYQRAVIASTVLSARLRATRRTGRALYDDVVVHQQAAMPEQLLIPFPDADSDAAPSPGRRST